MALQKRHRFPSDTCYLPQTGKKINQLSHDYRPTLPRLSSAELAEYRFAVGLQLARLRPRRGHGSRSSKH